MAQVTDPPPPYPVIYVLTGYTPRCRHILCACLSSVLSTLFIMYTPSLIYQ